MIRWQNRFCWQRPAALTKRGPDYYRAKRFPRPYAADAVGTARALVLGSALPLRRIASQAGVSHSTVLIWMRRHGWTRPPAARRPPRPVYGPAVVAAARELYQITALPNVLIAARVGATRERVAFWARRNGWMRPRDLPDPHGRYPRRRRPG